MLFAQIFSVSLGLLGVFGSHSLMALEVWHAQADSIPANCQLLKEVSTGATEITKKIESIGIGNNFNTDFDVPSGVAFKSYKAMMQVQNDAGYNVAINLKYGDNSVSTVLQKKDVAMVRGEIYDLPFTPPTDNQPYQINFNIAGPNNNTYTISLMACK